MEKITLLVKRTTKESGKIKLRFRLRDGRETDLYRKSNIIADLKDLEKLTIDGNLAPGIRKISPELDRLKAAISREMAAMSEAYHEATAKGERLNSEQFSKLVDRMLDPTIELRKDDNLLLYRFDKYVEDSHKEGIIGQSRYLLYKLVRKELERFLTIQGKVNVYTFNFTANDFMLFRQFLIDEYKYISKWQYLYQNEPKRNIPKEPRSNNTVSTRIKQLKAFFNSLEETGEIDKSPFRKLGKERAKAATRELYSEPVFLTAEELASVMKTDVPPSFEETKAAFLLQCALGCRIADFQRLKADNLSIDKNGIPYIHYLPHKTVKEQRNNAEIETPIMLYALDIIKQYGIKFNILHNISGKNGYNVKIKQLLEFCNIDRRCNVFDEKKQDNVYKPVFELASSKLSRKTHVDIMSKVQIDLYASGLHRVGSEAVNHYTAMGLKDRFRLMCLAFGQPEYKVDENLNVIL